MADDIQPLTPLNPTPLVREKRHYRGEQEQQAQQNKQQKKSPPNEPESETEDEVKDETAKKQVEIDGKNVTVRHIDEYA